MANTDNTFIQMHQKLKQLFPEIPDNIIYNHAVQQFPHDLQKCIEVLKRYRHRQAFLTEDLTKPSEGKDAFVYQNQEFLTPFRSMERHDTRGQSNGLSSPSMGRHSPLPMRWIPATYNSSSGVRSVSVSGVPPVSTVAGALHSAAIGTAQQQPQSAPVMPSHYEPFHLEYHPGMERLPMNVPPISDTTCVYPLRRESYFDHQHVPRYYNYEMHVRHTQEQRAQKDRLQHKLTDDKRKLDLLRADIMKIETEIRLSREQRSKQDPLFSVCEEIRLLREVTSRLRNECHKMSKDVDERVKGEEVPLGETSLDFYANINPGQCGPVGVPPAPSESTTISSHPPASHISPTLPKREQDDDQQWGCSACTFLNNGALNKCEMCDMPRFSTATSYA